MWIAIGVLFVLSWIEAAIEACDCGTFMPYHKALQPLPEEEEEEENNSNTSNNENQLEQGPGAVVLQLISESPEDDPKPV